MSLSKREFTRYSRHILLSEIGLEGQQTLKDASVLVVGAGGLGAPALLYLAAAGVGRLGVADFDVVELSNLQRQVIHHTCAVGQLKAESARERIRAINPEIQVEIFTEAVHERNVIALVSRYDVVIDGTDNFPTRYLLNDACVLSGRPYVYGSIYHFEGQASVFNYKGGPHYRDLFPDPPDPDAVPSCSEAGVLGVLPGIIGTIQATEALKILLGLGTSLSGRLLLFDALQMRFREIRFEGGSEPIRALRPYPGFCGLTPPVHTPPGAQVISPLQLHQRMADGWSPLILDVRSPREAQIVALPFAQRCVPYRTLPSGLSDLKRDQALLVYCRTGGRSTKAVERLLSVGFTRVFHLEAGVNGWVKDVQPHLPSY